MDVSESLRQLDIAIFRDLNIAGTNVVLDALMVALTIAGMGYVIILVVVPLWLKSKKEAAFDLVVIVLVVTVLTEAIKVLVDRPRPYLELSGVHTILLSTGPSFPSAHASRAFAVAYLISLSSKRHWGIIGLTLAGLISISRVYLGVHWPSDVFFGGLFGLSVAAMMLAISKKSQRYDAVRSAVTGRIASALSKLHRTSRSAIEIAAVA